MPQRMTRRGRAHPGHRNLLLHAAHAAMRQGAFSLDPAQPMAPEGAIETIVAGRHSVVSWVAQRCDEIQLTVWWGWWGGDMPHPGLPRPVVRKGQTPRHIVAACVTGWIERRTGQYVQGQKERGVVGLYCARDQRAALAAIPEPEAQGLGPEGRFFL